VWKHLKADKVGRMAVSGKDDFKRKVRLSMRQLQNDPKKILSFYQKPSLPIRRLPVQFLTSFPSPAAMSRRPA